MIASALDVPGARQASMDAGAAVLLARHEAVRAIDEQGRSSRPDVAVIATGRRVRRVLLTLCQGSREILSVRGPEWTANSLLISHPANLRLREDGIRMTSLFDSSQTDACAVLPTLRGTPYQVCHGPVELKVFDRRCVVMEGPVVDGEFTIVTMSTPKVVREALRYVSVARSTAVPAAALDTGPPPFTSRQAAVAELLSEELSDEAIAAAIGVSVRTVRSDVAEILRTLGVRTRFAAGFRLAALSADQRADSPGNDGPVPGEQQAGRSVVG